MPDAQNEFHSRLSERQHIEAAVKFVNDSIKGRGLNFREDTDGRYKSLAWINIDEPGMMIVLASFDFSYYHDLELVFYDTGFTNLPKGDSWWDHWAKNQLELSEKDFPDGFEFRFNIGTGSDNQYIIRAKGFSYYLGNVSHSR
jgi:hypothetical protein